eukprot:scaffold681_cov173-Ochromonas_danica.AAC.7
MTSLQVISVDCESHSPIIALITENGRAIFDAGEGVQRLVVEHKVRLGKLSHVFLTSHEQTSLGGLPGMWLTSYDAGVTNINLVGSQAASDFLSATSIFMRPFTNFSTVSSSSTYEYLVDKVRILAVPLANDSGVVEKVCYIGSTPTIAGKFLVSVANALGVPKGPLFGQLKNGKPITLPNGRTILPEEVLEAPELGRHFAIIAAIESTNSSLLNALFDCTQFAGFYRIGDLSTNESKTIDRQDYQDWMSKFGVQTRHIFAGDGCCRPYSSFVASSLQRYGLYKVSSDAFAPEHQLSSLPRSKVLERHQEQQEGMFDSDKAGYFAATALMKVHIAPARKSGFEDVLQELLAGMQATRAEVEDRIGKVAGMIENTRRDCSSDIPPNVRSFGKDRLIFLGTGCAIPSKYRNVSGILYYAADSRSAMIIDAGEGSWYQLITICPSVVIPDYQAPSSGIVEQDRKTAWAELLKVVWISHGHADHHLGLASIILERKKALMRTNRPFTPLVVIAPMYVIRFLHEVSLSVSTDLIGGYLAVPCQLFDPTYYCNACSISRESSVESNHSVPDARTSSENYEAKYSESCQLSEAGISKRQRLTSVEDPFAEYQQNASEAQEVLLSMHISQLHSIPVIHCPQAFALVFVRKTGSEEMKVIYSGDTRPCDLLIQYGANAAVVIHEATFEDDKAEEALQKKHSTINEALEVAQKMNAYRVLLTHFSQRYHGVPKQLDASGESLLSGSGDPIVLHEAARKAFTASDFMCIRIEDLSWAPVLTQALLELFPPPPESSGDDELN